MKDYYIKTNRTFTNIRKYAWIFTILVAIGGLWEPKLGLFVVFIMIGLIITAFFTGRYWCGNFCPHGSLFDKVLMPISLNKKIPNFLKSKPLSISFFIFFTYNFSKKVINVFSLWGSLDFFDKLGAIFSNTYLIVLVIGGFFAVFINPRTWCQFCPMGTMQKLSYILGKITGVNKNTEKKITISNKDMCYTCGKCSKVCPFQLAPYLKFSEDNQFDNIDCIKCATCVENCPADILSLKTKKETNI
ncbi:4Fe-4S binding protein [Schnuerera sp. xch1]|uniref:4Fe-4S binding protein n=1 Tax=Schnuerera sp. xch1 TaxID=2874283 RepID=UPI001CBBC476|nr:4Fe-4S binding protein [Schnuerera sp. xch1]MBZ2175826.1 4Fe-4S binding protein [Schnuerera sp. xch1]